MSTKVYRYRVKFLNGLLNKQARAVNFVWNFCNNTQKHALRWRKRWPTGFDLRGLAKTKQAKSVNDAAWSSFRNLLRYKAITHGATVEEVNESFSSQTCSTCGSLPESRPKGIAGLRIRGWQCSDCGAIHDRDVNAALNMLRSGHRAPVVGIPGL